MAGNGRQEGGWSSSHGSKRQSNQLWESDWPALWQDPVSADSRDWLYHDRVHRAEAGTARHHGRNIGAERTGAARLSISAQSTGFWLSRRHFKYRLATSKKLQKGSYMSEQQNI